MINILRPTPKSRLCAAVHLEDKVGVVFGPSVSVYHVVVDDSGPQNLTILAVTFFFVR